MAYGANTNWANEQKYLANLASTGSAQERAWAEKQQQVLAEAQAKYADRGDAEGRGGSYTPPKSSTTPTSTPASTPASIPPATSGSSYATTPKPATTPPPAVDEGRGDSGYVPSAMTSNPYSANTNYTNEAAYLAKLAASGNEGEQKWAKAQQALLDAARQYYNVPTPVNQAPPASGVMEGDIAPTPIEQLPQPETYVPSQALPQTFTPPAPVIPPLPTEATDPRQEGRGGSFIPESGLVPSQPPAPVVEQQPQPPIQQQVTAPPVQEVTPPPIQPPTQPPFQPPATNVTTPPGQGVGTGGEEGEGDTNREPPDPITKAVLDQPEMVKAVEVNVAEIETIMGGFTSLQNDAVRMGNEALVMLNTQWEQMQTMLNQMEQKITSQITSQMGQDDPAMKRAIDIIKEEAERMRLATRDEMNARGILQSGIYAKAMNEMNRQELGQIQATISARFGDLQNQLNQAVMSLANTRISAFANMQQRTASQLQANQSNVLSVGAAGLQAQLTARGQQIDMNRFNQQMAQSQNQFNQQMAFNQQQLSQQAEQFSQQLTADSKQFYDNLNQQSKLAYAQISANQGIQAANQALENAKWNYEKGAYEQQTEQVIDQQAYTQVQNATIPGGFASSAAASIAAGNMTIDQTRSMLTNAGYVPKAIEAIIQYIMTDPAVQKKLNSATATTPIPSTGYTPSTGGTFVPQQQQ